MGSNKRRKSKTVHVPTKNKSPFDREIVNKLNKINDNLESVNRQLEDSSKMRSFFLKTQSICI